MPLLRMMGLIAFAAIAFGVSAAEKPSTTAPCCCTVRIKSVKIARVQLKSPNAAEPTEDSKFFDGLKEEQANANRMQTDEKLLVVRIEVTNTGPEKWVYHSLNGSDEKCPTYANLQDDARKVYALAKFGDFDVVGSVKGATEIAPGKTVNDLLVFEVPPKSIKSLKMNVPQANVESKGAVQPVTVSVDGLKLAGG